MITAGATANHFLILVFNGFVVIAGVYPYDSCTQRCDMNNMDFFLFFYLVYVIQHILQQAVILIC